MTSVKQLLTLACSVVIVTFCLSVSQAHAACIDIDGDGYGLNGDAACTNSGIDCDDNDANVHPGAARICDGKDSNCDGRRDFSSEVDTDGDGVFQCQGDCNDNDPARFPGNPEICDGLDNDCAGGVPTNELDSDGDGQMACTGDCDDSDASVYTGNIEICSDGKDNNCDTEIDEATCSCPDADGDTYKLLGCTDDIGTGDDCDDNAVAVNPGAAEVCDDNVDNDCNGSIDCLDTACVGVPPCSSCVDGDGDSFFIGGAACGTEDCDDTDPNVYPGAPRICDAKDSNCDGRLDFSTDVDVDGDGVPRCASDCNDNDPARFPGNTEDCDGIDNDCAGGVPTNELDIDGDGQMACAGDCDDSDASVYTGNIEICSDGKDNNCDSVIDEATCICPDADGDTYKLFGCIDGTGTGADCDDTSAAVNPGASEVCDDGIDNNCNGDTDCADTTCTGVPPCDACVDSDGDTFSVGGAACGTEDCDDTDANVYPGAARICDGKDSNCDGRLDFSTDVDADGDGVPRCASDCDDNDPNNFPGNREVCDDGSDNDCDGLVDAADLSDCGPAVCGTSTGQDPPHMATLLNPDGSTHPDQGALRCGKCHDAVNIDDPIRYACQRCHADPADPSDPLNGTLKTQYPLDYPYGFGSAPNVKVHSSTVVGTQYGDWDLGCVNCHNPHLQEQNNKFGTSYGKLVKESICFDDPSIGVNIAEKVEFTSAMGIGSFADGAPYNANICETCHTRTNHHQNDGDAPGGQSHYDSDECTRCHTHEAGFAPVGGAAPPPHDTAACEACHVTPDTYVTDANIPSSACLSCHDATAPGTGSGGSDIKLVSHWPTMNCVECHNPMSVQTNFRGNTNLAFVRSMIDAANIAWDPDLGAYVTHYNSNNIAFEDRTGDYSFAADASTVADMNWENYICNTCHNGTNHHQWDGDAPGGQDHYDGQTCTACHAHDNSFQPSSACDACHGYAPIVNTPQPVDGLVEFPEPTGSITAGAHEKHTASPPVGYGYPCSTCHVNGMSDTDLIVNNKIQIGFDIFGLSGAGTSYDGQTLNAPYSYEGTNGTSVTTGGTKDCSNLYCHSSGIAVATASPPPAPAFDRSLPANSSSPWDTEGPLSCNTCHGYPPDYTNANSGSGYKSNSHSIHENVTTCDVCHFATTLGGVTITNSSKHANGFYDVVPNPAYASFEYVYDAGGGRCNSISCHGGISNHHNGFTFRWGFHSITVGAAVYATGACAEVNIVPSITHTYPYNAGGYTYYIEYGDGAMDEGTGPFLHAYPTPGNYMANIWARDIQNHRSLDPKILPVTAPAASNQNPVVAKNISIDGYTMTLTDLSYDPDYNVCGHSGPGTINILWGNGARTDAALDLTDQPSGQVYAYTFPVAGQYTLGHFVGDNAGSPSINSGNYTFTVPQFPPLIISGKVTQPNGSGYFNREVRLYRENGVSYIKSRITDANGNYDFGDVSEYGENCYVVKPYTSYLTYTPTQQTVCESRSDVNFTAN